MRMSLLCLGLILVCSQAPAAYRVYVLKVEHLDEYGRTERTELTLSHLDPLQYEQYFGGVARERVTMMETWFCPGDTSHHRPYCAPPKKTKNGRRPASADDRTRVPLSRQPVMP